MPVPVATSYSSRSAEMRPSARREDDVALGDQAVRVAEELDLVGEQRASGAERKLDLAGQDAVVALALGLQRCAD